MFCSNCGAEVKENQKFCAKCGSALHQQGTRTPLRSAQRSEQPRVQTVVDGAGRDLPKKGRKKWLPALIGAAAVIAVVIVAAKAPHISFQECDWCGATPTLAYNTHEGKSYVCADCRSECFWCGERADRHYECNAGMMVFVCDDCYYEMVAE